MLCRNEYTVGIGVLLSFLLQYIYIACLLHTFPAMEFFVNTREGRHSLLHHEARLYGRDVLDERRRLV
jgi:hypothetical protein